MESFIDKSPRQITIDSLENLDLSIIADLPWAQKLWEDVQEHTKKGFLNWCNIAKKLVGTRAEYAEEWSKQYCDTIDETYCDLVFDLVRLQSKTMDRIQDLLSKLQNICVELHQKMPLKIGEVELSLFEEQNKLVTQIQEYEHIINEKKKELDHLCEKQTHLCKRLGEEPKFTIKYPPLPTSLQLEDFQKYVDQLESKKIEREEKYSLIEYEILELAQELKYQPTSEFEMNVLSSDNFIFSMDNMKQLEVFLKTLQNIKKSTEEEVSLLRGKIEDLWKMLEIDLMDRDEFRRHYPGNSITTLEALRLEVKRCEEIRKANIKIFVDKLRDQLEEMWKKCHCSDSAKRSFKYFNSDCYTEDLLDLHDIEIKKWKVFYEENFKLLSLLEKHSELWEKVIELEENVSGPNRYKNRGGKLLQEEKERNKLSKLIPKIEEEILELSEKYRINNGGISFTSFGRTPEEYISHMHAERENVKKLKLSARKIQRDVTTTHTPAKSAVNLFPSTSTAVTPSLMSSTKRKILATPNTDSKRMRVNTPKSLIKPKGTPVALPKIKVNNATLSLPRLKRRSRASLERRKRLENIRKTRKSKSFDRAEINMSRNTTYDDFQIELSSKEQCRSTILPDQMLLMTPSASSTPAASSTRQKTPLNTPRRTPGTAKSPLSRTANSAGKGDNVTKLSTCKSNLKLIF